MMGTEGHSHGLHSCSNTVCVCVCVCGHSLLWLFPKLGYSGSKYNDLHQLGSSEALTVHNCGYVVCVWWDSAQLVLSAKQTEETNLGRPHRAGGRLCCKNSSFITILCCEERLLSKYNLSVIINLRAIWMKEQWLKDDITVIKYCNDLKWRDLVSKLSYETIMLLNCPSILGY